jgi:flagellar hook-length control protein FliK
MNTVRTDPQSFLFQLPAARAAAPARNDSGDAFSQILDKHLNGRNDTPGSRDASSSRDAPSSRDTSDLPRSRSASRSNDDGPEARETAEKGRSGHAASRRSDGKTDKASAAKSHQNSAAKRPEAKSDSQKATATDASDSRPQKTAGKTQADDSQQASDADAGIAGQPATADGKAGNAASDGDGKTPSDGNPDGQQESGDSGDKPASQSQNGDGAATAGTNPARVQVAPLQGLAILQLTGQVTAQTAAGGQSLSPAVQAALLAATGKNTVLEALAALKGGAPATGQGGDIIIGGLKFGTILPTLSNGRNAQGLLGAASGLPDDFSSDNSQTAAPSMNPVNSAISAAAKGKTLPDSNSSQTTTDNARNTADRSGTTTPVMPDPGGKTPAFTLSLPGNRPNASVQTAALENDVTASVTVTGGDAASGDAELSAFSQYLGPNAASSLASANVLRQSSFMTELKQSLQALPPHEQIAVQIQNAMQNGSSRMTVDLQPAELGRVEIKLDVDKDKNVSATIVADRPATLDLLQRDSKALERALQQAGLQADSGSLSFSLRDTGGQSGGRGQGGNGRAGGKGSDKNTGVAALGEPAKTDVVAIANGYVDLET